MFTFLLLNIGACVLAILVARAVATRPSLRLLCALCGFVIIIHSAMLAVGLAGRLSVGSVAALLVVALAGVVWWTRRASGEPEDAEPRGRFTVPTLVAPLVAVVTGGVWAWPHVVGPTRLWIWDDYTYHMVYPALWLRDRVIAAVTPTEAFTMQAWYPLSASVVSAWFMLPFAGARGDALAWVSLTAVLYAGIVASGAAEVLARLGCRPGAWAVPVVLLLTSHRIGVMASSFSDADLAHAALLFAAFVFAVPRGDDERREDLRVDAAFAALLTGLAVGVKVSAVPTALIVFLMLAWRARALDAWMRAGVWLAAVFAAGWMVTGGYWYARNLVHTGNPGVPGGIPPLAGRDVSPDDAARVRAALWRGAHGGRCARRLPQLAALSRGARPWPVSRVSPRGWPSAGARSRDRRRGSRWGALAVVVVTLILLPGTPYSAGNGMTFAAGLIHWDSMRYVALLPILGWVALGFLIDAGAGAPSWRTLAAVAVAAGGWLTWELTLASALAMLTAGAVGAALIARVGTPDRRARCVAARCRGGRHRRVPGVVARREGGGDRDRGSSRAAVRRGRRHHRSSAGGHPRGGVRRSVDLSDVRRPSRSRAGPGRSQRAARHDADRRRDDARRSRRGLLDVPPQPRDVRHRARRGRAPAAPRAVAAMAGAGDGARERGRRRASSIATARSASGSSPTDPHTSGRGRAAAAIQRTR